ncbi:MAG TPA: dihydrolipoyl dehydrogenase [Polyangia bacterium]|nr:dihydrolipoyl dehydrogenase [Polyangia bacterium]
MGIVDVIIVGAGTAGLGALREVRKRTDSFIIVNDGPWGTMCARVGCMPSKALIEAAGEFHRRLILSELGLSGGDSLRVDAGAVLARVRKMRDGFVSETRELTDDLGDRAISGRARLRGPHEVEVDGRVFEARSIVIATGSRPVVPADWEVFADRLLTTDSLFEQSTLPSRLAVVGLGPVGLEMAQALARLGVQVTGFHAGRTIAGLCEGPVNDTALDILRHELNVHLGHGARLTAEGDGLRVTAGAAGMVVDRVLVAMGRSPCVQGFGLENLGVPLDEKGLPTVDRATLQVPGLPVFLAGDANAEVPLQHEAADDGHIAGLNAVSSLVKRRVSDDRGSKGPSQGPFGRRFVRRTPLSIVFSDPALALVGRRFDALDPDRVVVGEARFTDQGRARIMLRNAGLLRICANREDGALVGAELFAPEGEHLAHWLALAIHRRSTVFDLLRAPFYHPTVEEGLRTALVDIAKQLPAAETFPLVSAPAE